ncbi:MAG: class I SAM-dependent methyltransferase [Proteobacteria bacterium]|nr:class I SAM-dependent methyltransferase [Pseudomonadota bacterium]
MVKEQFQKNKIGWKKSFFEGFLQDDLGDAVPWMTYPMIEFLKNNLNKNHEVFEFGCGASTLFFAKRVKKVIGIETNARWFEIVKEKLSKQGYAADIQIMEDGLESNLYENFAKNSKQKFDLIIIDSLKRFECAKNSIHALKSDGAIILDDSERKNYKKIFDFFAENNFKQQSFLGIAPGQLRIKNTTIFTKN